MRPAGHPSPPSLNDIVGLRGVSRRRQGVIRAGGPTVVPRPDFRLDRVPKRMDDSPYARRTASRLQDHCR